MKFNASKTKTMIVSGSRTMHPQSPALTIGGTVLKESDDLVILGVTFEKHLRSVSRAASLWLGILKSWQVFHDRLLLGALGVLSSPFWNTALRCGAQLTTHGKLLDYEDSGASFLTGGVFECDLAHRRSAAVLCMLYKIRCNLLHPLYGALPVPVRVHTAL